MTTLGERLRKLLKELGYVNKASHLREVIAGEFYQYTCKLEYQYLCLGSGISFVSVSPQKLKQ